VNTKGLSVDPEGSAIERIAASRTFARAPRAVELLRHVAAKAAKGEAEAIKEYTIALEVFHRENYNPKVDSLVRVEAAKLRELLEKYYDTEGRDDPVRIEIRKGSYVPLFKTAPAGGPPEVAPQAPPSHPAQRSWLWIAAALTVAAAVALAIWRSGPTPLRRSSSAPLSLAVLPFLDVSPSNDRHYLSDGLTEELIHVLSRIEGLRVASRSSSFQYRGKDQDVRRVGQELKVQAVLEGSVRVERDRVRVTAQLVNTGDGFHLWSETFDRSIGDVLAIQSEIAGAIATRFNLDLRGTTRALIRPRTENAEAWHYYLRGADLAGRYTAVETAKAVQLLQAAVAADPKYAMAWAKLARTWIDAVDFRQLGPSAALPEAQRAARQALSIDPSLTEAHQVDGLVKIYLERDWPGAARSFEQAIALDPAYIDVRFDYARLVLNTNGRHLEAIDQLQQALAIDPREISLHNELANSHIKARQYDKALAALKVSRSLAPRAPSAIVRQGIVEDAQGRHADALPLFEEAAAILQSSWVQGHIGYALAKLGRHAEARRLIAEIEFTAKGKAPDADIGVIYAGLGETERALTHLEKAFTAFAPSLLWLKVDYRLDGLRREPRFLALLTKMHL
jgi:serine/threonine-protein kinase